MASYRKAVLLYNPVSGNRARREETVARVTQILRSMADEFIVEATVAAGSGAEQARRAIDAGADLVIAAGGDGTIFEILQGIATSPATLGVIPLGTGNVLAMDLGLPADPVKAAAQLATYSPKRIALGRIEAQGSMPRYFTVAAGVGVHAELIYNSGTAAKKRAGVAAYYVSGFRLLFAHKFEPFMAEITAPDGTVSTDEVLEMVAMRVSSFGRWLSRWRPGSRLTSPSMQLVLLKQSSRFAMIRYVFGALTGTAHDGQENSRSANVRFVPATKVRCYDTAIPRRIRVQADGELLGIMPSTLEMVPDALTLLMPASE